jgi:glycosyltransferase involved in cell wall biosynthesis
MAELMRIALAGTSTYDFQDPLSWSGVPVALREAFERRHDVQTVVMGPARYPPRIPETLRKGWYALRGYKYFWEREPRIIEHYTRQFSLLLEAEQPDVVIALCSLTAVALPSWVRPVLYTDSTWHSSVDYYETWSGLAPRSRRLGERSEQIALSHAAEVVVSSEWAARSVIDDYGYPPDRVTIQPMGAVHISPWGMDELESRIQRRLERPIELLWMGKEWERKGGAIGLEVARSLHERGVPVTLHLVGRYPHSAEREAFVRTHGFLDRRTQGALIDELFAGSFALLLPSRAEAASVVLADAASYALPSFASRTGGIPTMVDDGVSGVLLDPDATPAAIAEQIMALHQQPDRYRTLCRTSRQRFESTLNWDATASVLVEACHRAASADAAGKEA